MLASVPFGFRHSAVLMIEKTRKTPALAPAPASTPASRWAWLLVMIFGAGIVGGLAGVLSHAAGNNVPGAVLTGGGAFAGTVGLFLAIAHYARSE
jgi:hypothetical protein